MLACNNSSKGKVNTQMVNNELSEIKYEKTTGGPAITFDQKVYDFGQIAEGPEYETGFTFVNSGDEPLIILSAKGSCGCTVPEKPEAPIAPGEQGVIKVTFNSKGRRGVQNKKVTLTTNAKGEDQRVELEISSMVIQEEKK